MLPKHSNCLYIEKHVRFRIGIAEFERIVIRMPSYTIYIVNVQYTDLNIHYKYMCYFSDSRIRVTT